MNKLILCEGETDAVLLSYYLEQAAEWKYCKKAPEGLKIKANAKNQSVNWYRKNDDYLLICAVGGKDNFENFFKDHIAETLPLVSQETFEKVAFVTDRDDRKTKDVEDSINSALEGVSVTVKNNEWSVGDYKDRYGSKKTLEVLLVIIPKERQGALETAMLDAISEKPTDKKIVDETKKFASEMRRGIASDYIKNDGDELKVRLGLTWAIQYPEKVFRLIDEQIKNVRWEESATLRSLFSKLIEI